MASPLQTLSLNNSGYPYSDPENNPGTWQNQQEDQEIFQTSIGSEQFSDPIELIKQDFERRSNKDTFTSSRPNFVNQNPVTENEDTDSEVFEQKLSDQDVLLTFFTYLILFRQLNQKAGELSLARAAQNEERVNRERQQSFQYSRDSGDKSKSGVTYRGVGSAAGLVLRTVSTSLLKDSPHSILAGGLGVTGDAMGDFAATNANAEVKILDYLSQTSREIEANRAQEGAKRGRDDNDTSLRLDKELYQGLNGLLHTGAAKICSVG